MWLPITCPGWHISSLWEERDDVTGHTHSQRVAHRMKHTHTRHTSFPSACFIFLNNVKDSFLLFTAWQRDLGCTLGPCNAVSPTRIHTFTCMQCPLPQVSPIKQMQRIPSFSCDRVYEQLFLFPCLYKTIVRLTFQFYVGKLYCKMIMVDLTA